MRTRTQYGAPSCVANPPLCICCQHGSGGEPHVRTGALPSAAHVIAPLPMIKQNKKRRCPVVLTYLCMSRLVFTSKCSTAHGCLPSSRLSVQTNPARARGFLGNCCYNQTTLYKQIIYIYTHTDVNVSVNIKANIYRYIRIMNRYTHIN